MVRKLDPWGAPYHEPPYTWEEKRDFYRRIGGGPVTVVKRSPGLHTLMPSGRNSKQTRVVKERTGGRDCTRAS
jgi:hypothetical protein